MAIRKALVLSWTLAAWTATLQAQAARRPARPAPAATPQGVPSAPAVPPPLPPGFDYQVRVAPETVAVGLPFHVAVHVRAPAGTRVQFPAGPDSGTAVEALDPATERSRSDSVGTDVTAIYRLAAWDVGRLPIALGNVVVVDRGGEHAIALRPLSVIVAATVPPRGAARAPRPARAYYPDREPWWWRWVLVGAAVAVLLIGWLLVRWLRRRARRPVAPPGPLATAERELGDLEHLGLVEAGEWGRYVTLVADVVRRFLARRLPDAPLSSTTSELVTALYDDARVPLDRLRALLVQIDLVKFAGQHMNAETVTQTSRAAHVLMSDIDTAVTAAAAAAREAAARQTSREFEERRTARAIGSKGRAA